MLKTAQKWHQTSYLKPSEILAFIIWFWSEVNIQPVFSQTVNAEKQEEENWGKAESGGRTLGSGRIPLEFWPVILNLGASPVVQVVKNLPAVQETQVQSLNREDPLEKETATHSSVLVWRIPWTAYLVGYSPWCCKESDTTEWLTLYLKYTGALSCLFNLYEPQFSYIGKKLYA